MASAFLAEYYSSNRETDPFGGNGDFTSDQLEVIAQNWARVSTCAEEAIYEPFAYEEVNTPQMTKEEIAAEWEALEKSLAPHTAEWEQLFDEPAPAKPEVPAPQDRSILTGVRSIAIATLKLLRIK